MNIRYIRLQSGDLLPALDDFSPYKAVVVVEEDVKAEWQAATSRWLANSGCLYMMAWGTDCSSWDDSVDLANMEQFNFDEIPEDNFIVTTWHENQSIDDVIFFAKFSALHTTSALENVLFLHIGSVDRQGEFEDLYRKAS